MKGKFLFIGRGKQFQVDAGEAISESEAANTMDWPFRVRRPIHGDVDVTQLMDRNAEREENTARHYGRGRRR